MKTGKNVLKATMLILVSIIISQSAMAENFPTNESFLYGDWKNPYYANVIRFYQDHTTGESHYQSPFSPHLAYTRTWSYDANTGTVMIYGSVNGGLKLVAESRNKLSGHVFNADGEEASWVYSTMKVQVACGGEDYNNDGSFDIDDFTDKKYDVKYDFEIRRQNLDTEIERQNLDKELETELAKIHEELRSCWTQKCD